MNNIKEIRKFIILLFKCYIIILFLGFVLPRFIEFILEIFVNSLNTYRNTKFVFNELNSNKNILYRYMQIIDTFFYL